MDILRRPRRNRKSSPIREMVAETVLRKTQLIHPLFIQEGNKLKTEISSMPDFFRFSPDLILKEIEESLKLGIQNFILFPQIEEKLKDKKATLSYKKNNLYLKMIQSMKKEFPDATIITDVAMDPYSSDGHDGFVENGKILNDESLVILGKMALAQAESGADILGPFRDALGSAPKAGDKKTYQMDPRNAKEALLEAELDFQEGADYLMVKPALAYLDIIQSIKQNFPIPVVAYNVSGEYAMIKAAARLGWLDESKAMVESLIAIKRAGADIIITYFAKDFAKLNLT